MRLFLSVHLPLLPLETLRPSWFEAGAYAVMHKDQVCLMSPQAARCGVQLGLRAGGVAALAPDTVLLQRSRVQEQAALDALSLALLQFTPELVVLDDASILLDVSASLRLFGGPVTLCRRVSRVIAALGFSAQLGAAPTAQGACLLARSRREPKQVVRRRVLQMRTLAGRLDQLPLALLPSTLTCQAWLELIGASNLGALRRLPRSGLMRRASKQLMDDLDRAYGELPQLFDWIKPSATFFAQVETFDRIEHAEALMFGATRLILQLTGWLVAQQLAVTTWTLFLEHERGRSAMAPTALVVTMAEPAWQADHLLRLLKERLAKLTLTAPVRGLRLEAQQLQPLKPLSASLFPEPGGSPADFQRLLELLSARLGAANVMIPAPVPDHRPELSNVWLPASGKPVKSGVSGELFERPFFVLPKPIALLIRNERPFYGSPLKLIGGPERIEAGWWSEPAVARDYYVAQGLDSSCYWIYLERSEDARWFLHGLYA